MIHLRNLIVSLLFFLSGILSGQSGEVFESGYYFGYIEEVYPIAFKIFEEGGQFSGTVIFPLTGDSILIEVDDLGERFILTEFDTEQAVIGFYFLKKEKNAWVGNWQDRNGYQSLGIKIEQCKSYTDWREKLLLDRKNEKWWKRYRLSEENNWTDLFMLRQAGRTANAVLSHELNKGYAIYLRGDCMDLDCRRLLFLNKSGEEDLLLEVNLNGVELSGFYFFQDREKAFNAEFKESVPLRAKYTFNQWLAFDALYPDFHPLMTAALEERIADWMSAASAGWSAEAKKEHPTLWDRFSSRHYVWMELLHFNEEYLSGYIEWIQNDSSVKMSSFVFDQAKAEWYWDEDLENNSLNPLPYLEISMEKVTESNAVFVVVPGGWQRVTSLDKLEGRQYRFYKASDFEKRIPRTYRKWFK